VVARVGLARSRRQELTAARTELERALAGLPGSPAAGDLAGGGPYSVEYAWVAALGGDLHEASAVSVALANGQGHPSVVAGASQVRAWLHLAAGDPDGAHGWLDAAAGAARTAGDDEALAVIHAQRASVVAGSGRTVEASAMAFEALERWGRSRPVRLGQPPVLVATALSQVAVAATRGGDSASGRLLVAALAGEPRLVGRPVGAGEVAAADAVVQLAEGNPERALRTAEWAAGVLSGAGAEVGRLRAVRTQAEAARALGWTGSARLLAQHAEERFGALELSNEAEFTKDLMGDIGT
jgi:ATP/maltotriose-dependent transcriptional regulator MalT